jgi:hypothetical protein
VRSDSCHLALGAPLSVRTCNSLTQVRSLLMELWPEESCQRSTLCAARRAINTQSSAPKLSQHSVTAFRRQSMAIFPVTGIGEERHAHRQERSCSPACNTHHHLPSILFAAVRACVTCSLQLSIAALRNPGQLLRHVRFWLCASAPKLKPSTPILAQHATAAAAQSTLARWGYSNIDRT